MLGEEKVLITPFVPVPALSASKVHTGVTKKRTERRLPLPFRIRLAHVLPFLFILSSDALTAQHAGNSNPFYQQMRALLPGGEVILVDNFELKRDAATFTFRRGDFAFFGEVNGKVTGAVFKGDGHFHLVPPTAEERHNLAILNHSEVFDEDFDQVVLRFTDS